MNKVIKFTLLFFIFILSSCQSVNEEKTIKPNVYQLNTDELKKSISNGTLNKDYGIYYYYYSGKVININDKYIDFQNGDLVFRTLIEYCEGPTPEINKSYMFGGKIYKYEYETLYMDLWSIKESRDIEVLSYSTFSNVQELLSMKSSRFELKNILVDKIIKKETQDGILIDFFVCFKAGDDTIALEIPGTEEFDFDIQKGDRINLSFNNFINDEYDSLKEEGIDYLLTDFLSIYYEKIVD